MNGPKPKVTDEQILERCRLADEHGRTAARPWATICTSPFASCTAWGDKFLNSKSAPRFRRQPPPVAAIELFEWRFCRELCFNGESGEDLLITCRVCQPSPDLP
jgi:hypothetical protein